MPQNTTAILRYGPYRQSGIVEYREERLRGLQNQLTLAGHQVQLERSEDWNIVEIWVHGEKVFSCDIQDLEFQSDGQLDENCSKALIAVAEAY